MSLWNERQVYYSQLQPLDFNRTGPNDRKLEGHNIKTITVRANFACTQYQDEIPIFHEI
jgi:hypothetical protein